MPQERGLVYRNQHVTVIYAVPPSLDAAKRFPDVTLVVRHLG